MNSYSSRAEFGKTTFRKSFRRRTIDEKRVISTALSYLDASKALLKKNSYLSGFGKSCRHVTDARLSDRWESWSLIYTLLLQWTKYDAENHISQTTYIVTDYDITGPSRVDLKALKLKAKLELNARHDNYIAKFSPLVSRDRLILILSVLALSGATKSIPTNWQSAESVILPSFELASATSSSAKPGFIAAMVAEFIQPWDTETMPSPFETPGLFVNALVYRGLMPVNRIFFGHGDGESVVRCAVAQLMNSAAASDIFNQSPLQPDGIVSFLAGLPMNHNGLTAALPRLVLP